MNNDSNNQVNGMNGVSSVGSNVDINNNQVQPQQPNDSIIPITPIVPVNLESQPQNVSSNNGIQNASDVIPIMSMPEFGNNNVSQTSVVNEQKVLVPDAIPMSNDNSALNSNVVPELKLDSSSPFDIGINQSNGIAVNDNNLGNGHEQSNVTPITPVNMNNNIDNNSSVTNNSANLSSDVSNDNVVSVGQYIIHMLLCFIPIVGFIVLLVRAFGKNNKNISNLAKAQLIMGVAVFVLGLLLFVVYVTIFASMFSRY